MSKLRSDSVFSQLTPEQVDLLEEWLFEENLSYKDALERVQKEFKLSASLSGLRRFYGRLAGERSQESLTDMVKACTDALVTAGKDGTLQAGMLTLATKVAVQMLVESPGKVREFTALLRAITSAQALEMKRVEFQRGEEKIKQSRLERERKDAEALEYQRKYREEYEARRKAQEEKRKAKLAAKAAEGMTKDQGQSSKELPSSKLETVEEKAAEGMTNDEGPGTKEEPSPKVQMVEEKVEAPEANGAVVRLEVVKEEAVQKQGSSKAPTMEEATRRGGCFRIIGG